MKPAAESTSENSETRVARNSKKRRGSAVVELAICLPVVMLIVASTLEISGLIFAYQSLQAAAHECSRVVAKRDATFNLTQSRMNEILVQRGVSGATLSITPSDLNLPRGTRYTIEVFAPFSTNSFVPPKLFGGTHLNAKCVVVKEL